MENLTIVTPCSRQENLGRIAQSLRAAREFFNVTWSIVHDCRSGSCDFPVPEFVTGRLDHARSLDGDCAGHYQANVALDTFLDGWVWRLDDDNLPVPGFFGRLAQLTEQTQGVDVFLFAQKAARRYDEAQWPDGVVPPIPKVGKMDSAQYVWRRDATFSLRFQQNDYCADGRFIEALCAKVGPCAIYSVAEPLTQYNALNH
jgi:hypothetical protein